MFRSLCPTNMSMMSANDTAMNRAPSSPATARAMKVLPHPGGPYSRSPPRSDLPYSRRSSGLRIGARNPASRRAFTSVIPATSASVSPGCSASCASAPSIPAEVESAAPPSPTNMAGSTSRSSSSAWDQSYLDALPASPAPSPGAAGGRGGSTPVRSGEMTAESDGGGAAVPAGSGGPHRARQQAQGLRVPWVALQDGAEVPDGLVALARRQQQRGQVQAERHIVGYGLDRLAEAVQHGGFGFHASVRVGSLVTSALPPGECAHPAPPPAVPAGLRPTGR